MADQPQEANQAPQEPYRLTRRPLPDERQSVTHKFIVGEQEGYITIGLYEDGSPGEVFIRMSKQGSMVSGFCDAFSLLMTYSLQYGVPLEGVTRGLKNLRFEPYGLTNNRQIPTATSIIDYLARWLERKFVFGEELLDQKTTLGPAPSIFNLDDAIPSGMGCPDCGSMLIGFQGCLICRQCGYTKSG